MTFTGVLFVCFFVVVCLLCFVLFVCLFVFQEVLGGFGVELMYSLLVGKPVVSLDLKTLFSNVICRKNKLRVYGYISKRNRRVQPGP